MRSSIDGLLLGTALALVLVIIGIDAIGVRTRLIVDHAVVLLS